jgi:hypothetical protein
VPLHLATQYWNRLLGSDRGEIYFDTRRSVGEMRALAADVKVPIPDPDRAPHLYKLYLVLQKEFDRGDSREGKENV